MKNTNIIFTTLFFLVLGISSLKAQDYNSEKHNYLVLSKNIQQLAAILQTSIALSEEDGEKYGDFYIIICGKTVNDIPYNLEFDKLLDKAKAQHIKVFVCGLSLAKFNIKESQLPHDIEITANGIFLGFQLSKKGFISLTL